MITYGYPSPAVEFYDDDGLFTDSFSEEEGIDLSFIIEEDDYIRCLIDSEVNL